MTTKEKRALIAHRLSCARESLEEAAILLDAVRLRGYVNRLYYAGFYAVSALLMTRNISSSKHGYVRAKLHEEFVKPGMMPVEMGKHFDLLFNSRLASDYKDHVTFEAHEVSGWLEQTQRFVSQVEGLLAEILGESGADK